MIVQVPKYVFIHLDNSELTRPRRDGARGSFGSLTRALHVRRDILCQFALFHGKVGFFTRGVLSCGLSDRDLGKEGERLELSRKRKSAAS